MSKIIDDSVLPQLQQQAIDWLVRLRSDDLEDDELMAFADWLAEGHKNSETFAEAELLFDQMSLAVKPVAETNTVIEEVVNKDPFKKKWQFNVREHLLAWLIPPLALIATCLLVVNLFLPQQMYLFDSLNSDFYTVTGELRDVQLSDGSQILLNTNTAVSVDYSDSNRSITLHHGQAIFTVAKDIKRPFNVNVEGVIVRALGTVFQVYKTDNDSVKVTVLEHAVSVQQIQNNKQSIHVKTGQQLHVNPGQALPEAKEIILNQETAWQDSRLIINDQPLGDLIAELERYKKGRIFLSDEKLKHLRVTGVFSLNDPDTILNSICKALDLKQTRVAGWWSIIHR